MRHFEAVPYSTSRNKTRYIPLLEAKNTLSKEKISLHHPYLISLTYTDFLVNASANLNSHDVKEEEIKGEYLQLG